MVAPRSFYRVYVIQNAENRFYIGLSDDVTRRLNDHNSGISKWTKGKGPWSLAWTSEAMSLSDAKKPENRLKRMKGGEFFLVSRGYNGLKFSFNLFGKVRFGLWKTRH